MVLAAIIVIAIITHIIYMDIIIAEGIVIFHLIGGLDFIFMIPTIITIMDTIIIPGIIIITIMETIMIPMIMTIIPGNHNNKEKEISMNLG